MTALYQQLLQDTFEGSSLLSSLHFLTAVTLGLLKLLLICPSCFRRLLPRHLETAPSRAHQLRGDLVQAARISVARTPHVPPPAMGQAVCQELEGELMSRVISSAPSSLRTPTGSSLALLSHFPTSQSLSDFLPLCTCTAFCEIPSRLCLSSPNLSTSLYPQPWSRNY